LPKADVVPFETERKAMFLSGGHFSNLSGFRIMPVGSAVSAAISCMIPGIKQFDIIYTNDIHGAMSPISTKEGKLEGGMAFVAGKIDELRQEARGNSLLLDGGDWGQGTMESNLSKGLVMTEIMNAIGYDAMEVGNHEFDWGPSHLNTIVGKMRVPLLGANIASSDGTPLGGVSPSVIKTIDGVKVGIIGLIDENAPLNAAPENFKGVQILKIKETAERCVEDLRKAGAELIVVLSHNGDKNDEKLAEGVRAMPMN
jgi:2',3'-cyclic-nucleotide 2'-phosphodiesterase (5'-nucleotidase family)